MATIKEVVLKYHKKEDCTYNIKYRLTHNRGKATKKDFAVKDKFLLSVVSNESGSKTFPDG